MTFFPAALKVHAFMNFGRVLILRGTTFTDGKVKTEIRLDMLCVARWCFCRTLKAFLLLACFACSYEEFGVALQAAVSAIATESSDEGFSG